MISDLAGIMLCTAPVWIVVVMLVSMRRAG